MKFSLCLETIFTDKSIDERASTAKLLGYDAIEIWDPAAYDLRLLDLAAATLPFSCMALVDNWGTRCNVEFDALACQIKTSIQIGAALGCNQFIALAGDKVNPNQKQRLIDNLRRAAEILERNNAVLLVEALNSTTDHPGYYLDNIKVCYEIIEGVGSPSVKLLFDIYHMQVMEGNIISSIREHIGEIGHFHAAGVPGRNELNRGELDYAQIVDAIETSGYSGYFGLEYLPLKPHLNSAREMIACLGGTAR